LQHKELHVEFESMLKKKIILFLILFAILITGVWYLKKLNSGKKLPPSQKQHFLKVQKENNLPLLTDTTQQYIICYVNTDSLPDLYCSEDSTKFYLNKGNFQFKQENLFASFKPKLTYSTKALNYDLNADGYKDLLLIDVSLKNPVQFFLNTKSNGYTEATNAWGLNKVFADAITIINENNDRFPDLLIQNHNKTQHYTGAQTFLEKTEKTINAIQANEYDLNNDALLDRLPYKTSSDSSTTWPIEVQVFPNFWAKVSNRAKLTVPAKSNCNFTDINADGLLDAFVTKQNANRVFIQQKSTEFLVQKQDSIVECAHKLLIEDFNYDGLPDILAINSNQKPSFYQNIIKSKSPTNTFSIKVPKDQQTYFLGALFQLYYYGGARSLHNVPSSENNLSQWLFTMQEGQTIDSIHIHTTDSKFRRLINPSFTNTINISDKIPFTNKPKPNIVQYVSSVLKETFALSITDTTDTTLVTEDLAISNTLFSKNGNQFISADCNQDSLSDLLIVNSAKRSIQLYGQNKDQSFGAMATELFNAHYYPVTKAIFTDYNQDGFTDLLTLSALDTNNTANKGSIVHLYSNKKGNSFVKTTVISTQEYFTDIGVIEHGEAPSMLLSSTNGPGKLIKISSKMGPEGLSFYQKYQTKGHITQFQISDQGNKVFGLNTKGELCIVNDLKNSLEIKPIANNKQKGIETFCLGDFNADNETDIAVFGKDATQGIYMGNGDTFSFEAFVGSLQNCTIMHAETSDINSDGVHDLVLFTNTSPTTLCIVAGNRNKALSKYWTKVGNNTFTAMLIAKNTGLKTPYLQLFTPNNAIKLQKITLRP
jgi:hypothetical protein